MLYFVPSSSPGSKVSTKSLNNFWHLEKVWASFDRILYFENLGGVDFSGSPCIVTRNYSCLELVRWKKKKKHIVHGWLANDGALCVDVYACCLQEETSSCIST